MNRADRFHFEAAQGWLGLGDLASAANELEEMAPQSRAHPDALQVRLKIYFEARKWDCAAEVANALCRLLPDSAFGPLHLAHALRQLDRTQDARAALLPIADKFPDEWRIQYQLACYSCKVGKLKEALQWIGAAIDVAGKLDIRTKALGEQDLEPLWLHISEI